MGKGERMTKLETWITILLAVVIITLLISYIMLKQRFPMPEYIPINGISV